MAAQQPSPKSSLLQTLLLAATIFLAWQLFFGNRSQPQVDVPALQKNFQKALADNDQRKIVDEGSILEQALRNRSIKPENPDPLLDNPSAIALKIAQAHANISIATKNYRDALSAWQQFHQLTHDPDKAIADSAKAQLEPTGKQVAILAADSSQHPFIAAGYHVVDFLVKMTGSVRGFSYWFAMLVLGVIVRTLAWPLSAKQYMGFKRMALLQPMIKELQAKYTGQELQTRTMKLYSKYGINPLAGCFPMLVQLPFFIWVYQCVYAYQPEFLKGTFLWINPSMHAAAPYVGASLGERDIPIIILYGISMVVTTLLTPTDPTNRKQARMMGLFTSLFVSALMFLYPLPSAFIFYWICINIVSTVQSLLFARMPVPPLQENDGNVSGGFFKLMTPQEGPNGTAKPIKTEKKTGAPVLHKPKVPKKRKK